MKIIIRSIFLLLFLPAFTLCQEHEISLDDGTPLSSELTAECIEQKLEGWKNIILSRFEKRGIIFHENGLAENVCEDYPREVIDEIMGSLTILAEIGEFHSTMEKVFRYHGIWDRGQTYGRKTYEYTKNTQGKVFRSIFTRAFNDDYEDVIETLLQENVYPTEDFLFWLIDGCRDQEKSCRYLDRYCDYSNVNAMRATDGIISEEALIHKATRHALSDVAAILLKKGADVSVQKWVGGTPLHLAVEMIHRRRSIEPLYIYGETKNSRQIKIDNIKEIAQMLLDNGADPHLPDRKDETPLDAAIKRDCRSVVGAVLARELGLIRDAQS